MSISVNRYDLTVGQELVVTGQVTGRNRNAGQRVELHAEVPKAYKKLGGIVGLDDTSSSGRFRFTVTPSVNTRYTVTVIEPTAQSETRRVYVYPRKSTEVDSIGGGRLVRINLYEAGAIYKPLVGARWAYFYARAYGARTWHRIGRGRLRPCCPGEDTGFVRAVKVVSLRRLPARGYVSGCTKTTAIRGLGRGAPYSACGRRTLRD